MSALYGAGFHPGTDATKDAVSGAISTRTRRSSTGEITALPGSAATPSQTLSIAGRSALDLELRLQTPLGTDASTGRPVIAQNLDRGFFVADPVATGIDVRDLGYYGSLVQEITPYGLIGFRTDVYDPNADTLDKKLGKLLPSTQRITTLSPLVGLQIPGRARLVFQYDVIFDATARGTRSACRPICTTTGPPSACRCSCEARRCSCPRAALAVAGCDGTENANEGLDAIRVRNATFRTAASTSPCAWSEDLQAGRLPGEPPPLDDAARRAARGARVTSIDSVNNIIWRPDRRTRSSPGSTGEHRRGRRSASPIWAPATGSLPIDVPTRRRRAS